MKLSEYKLARSNKIKRLAFTWEHNVWEAILTIGPEDAKSWVDNMEDILADPYFVKDPVPITSVREIVETRMKNRFPHVEGHTWVSPHAEAWHKLGYYQVWRPDGSMKEVFGEDKVREALGENIKQ